MTSCLHRAKNSPRFSGAFIGLLLVLLLQIPAVHAEETQDPIQNRFDAAMAAIDANDYYEARRLLQELVTDYPTLNRARLELARTNYYIRDYDAAAAEVERVLEDPDVPASVRPTLLAFLAQIRDDEQGFEQKNNWGSYLYSGVMYDSNVTTGVADVIPGSPVAATREKSDWAGILNAGLSHTYNPNKPFRANDRTGFFLWQSQLTGYYRAYTDENDYNLGVITARTGPVWAVADKWRFSLALQGDQYWFGSDRLAFFTAINPTFSWIFGPRTSIEVDAYWQDRDYNDSEDEDQDGTFWNGTVTLSQFFFDRRLGVQSGLGYSDFDADGDGYGYTAPEIFVGGTLEAWNRGVIYGRAGFRRYDYDENFALVTALTGDNDREDDEIRIFAGFRHQIETGVLSNWTINGEYVWTDNDSDVRIRNDLSGNPINGVDLFDYDRSQVTLGLSRAF